MQKKHGCFSAFRNPSIGLKNHVAKRWKLKYQTNLPAVSKRVGISWKKDEFKAERKSPMFGIGVPELVIILVIVLIIFGAGRLPEIGSGIGKAIRNFKGATKDDDGEKRIEAEAGSD